MATTKKVIVSKAKLDALADAISAKSGVSGKKTIDEMIVAIDSIGTAQ